eukprot:CAMPEP_0170379630 /NCGR_PEP_ID=MMETSP0117_2-20130122/13442_1 /TAXON_ID=400756 /ORGANISM="Durinskia baltica, Strain CSIRO CS-38" /LENGTH=198 /DNA_ID=CAMNT_0010635075 /DNA_START=203 /DNA_END=795 /DNA_ORIENTATION=-
MMISLLRIVVLLASLLSIKVLLLLPAAAAAFSPSLQKSFSTSNSKLFYVRDQSTSPEIVAPLEKGILTKTSTTTTTTVKPKIREIKSMAEFQYFLEEDNRPVAVKFYAPWCKTCKRLGLHFDRLALERGDIVRNRQKTTGEIRFAAIEYGSETARFITEKLQIRGVPTLQLYSGTYKLWEEHGSTSVKGLKQQLDELR